MADKIKEIRLERAYEIESATQWDCRVHEDVSEEDREKHEENCLGEMLNSYIADKRNYILDGAVISCDQMSEKKVFVQFMRNGSRIRIEGTRETIPSDYKKPDDIGPDGHLEQIIFSHVGEENIRKLYAVHGSEQSANHIPFATVIDRTCLRKEKAKIVTIKQAMQGAAASIVGCGNCKILREEDLKKIAENWDSVVKYGTCYLFINPSYEWNNPYCMESVVGKCNIPIPLCTVSEHHKPIKFDTTEGEKEGLTMLSTLLCTRGGIITIETPGQIYVAPKEIVEGVSDELIALLKSYETGADKNGKLLPLGEPALWAYHGKSDNGNVMTIGWGHAMFKANDGKITFEHIDEEDGTKTYITKNLYSGTENITYEEAEELLRRDIAEREKTINQQLKDRGIEACVNQQFYDALFLLYFQMGSIFDDTDFPKFLDAGNFDIHDNAKEIILQFCEYSGKGDDAVMKRRADELDIIFYGDYKRNDDDATINRYAWDGENIWGEVTNERKSGKR